MSVHFDKSFFNQGPELSFHKPSLVVKEDPFKHHFFAICGDKLYVAHKGDTLPAGAETDLRKIRDFVFSHLEEIGATPLAQNDNPLSRISERVSSLDFLIAKQNDHIENHLYTMMIRIISIFLLIVTFGLYNYKNSFRIDPINTKMEEWIPLLRKANSLLWSEKKRPEQERIVAQQKLLDLLKRRATSNFDDLLNKYPECSRLIASDYAHLLSSGTEYPLEKEIVSIALRDEFVAFYRSGPTASLSMFAECPNGIQIYSNKFSCVASALEYRKRQIDGFAEKDLEKFTSLGGEEALIYSQTLRDKKIAQQQGFQEPSADGSVQCQVMKEVLQAKYAQNRGMLYILLATGKADLLFHTPENSKVNTWLWGDGGNGRGSNLFGNMLEEIRSLASGKTSPKPPSGPCVPVKKYEGLVGNPNGYTIF